MENVSEMFYSDFYEYKFEDLRKFKFKVSEILKQEKEKPFNYSHPSTLFIYKNRNGKVI